MLVELRHRWVGYTQVNSIILLKRHIRYNSTSFSAIMVLLALTFLTPYFSYIPKATLAAVIICAVLFMVEVTITKLIWNIHSEYHKPSLSFPTKNVSFIFFRTRPSALLHNVHSLFGAGYWSRNFDWCRHWRFLFVVLQCQAQSEDWNCDCNVF